LAEGARHAPRGALHALLDVRSRRETPAAPARCRSTELALADAHRAWLEKEAHSGERIE
jgi:hypothetical protein